jgi:hypothetical protein
LFVWVILYLFVIHAGFVADHRHSLKNNTVAGLAALLLLHIATTSVVLVAVAAAATILHYSVPLLLLWVGIAQSV